MARPSNPNKEKIQELKSQIKEHSRTVRQGESAATKVTKLEERLAKLTGDDAAPAKKTAKVSKADKTEKKAGKKKLDAKAEKKAGKVVTAKKTRGRPKKVIDDEEDD